MTLTWNVWYLKTHKKKISIDERFLILQFDPKAYNYRTYIEYGSRLEISDQVRRKPQGRLAPVSNVFF